MKDSERNYHDVIDGIMAYGYEDGFREFKDDDIEISEMFYKWSKAKKYAQYFEGVYFKTLGYSEEIKFAFNLMRSCAYISELWVGGGAKTRGVILRRMKEVFDSRIEKKFSEEELKDIQAMSKMFFKKFGYKGKDCVIG